MMGFKRFWMIVVMLAAFTPVTYGEDSTLKIEILRKSEQRGIFIFEAVIINAGHAVERFEYLDCAFASHWQSDSSRVTVELGGVCQAPTSKEVILKPGEKFSEDLIVSIASEDTPATFRLGFIPFNSTATLWSDIIFVQETEATES